MSFNDADNAVLSALVKKEIEVVGDTKPIDHEKMSHLYELEKKFGPKKTRAAKPAPAAKPPKSTANV